MATKRQRAQARSAVYSSWARTPDWPKRTAPARKAFLARFERLVDPDGVLSPDERERRAEQARKAYFTTLSRKSAEARRRRQKAA
jgi:hypothetical protein